MRYRTIVADPPWQYEDGCVALGPGHGTLRARQPLPYAGLHLDAIKALPVSDLADRHSRLFLWTTNRYLPAGFAVVRSWGFEYVQTLVWHKTDVNLAGSVAPNSAEYVLVAAKGHPPRLAVMRSAVLSMPRRGEHSQKPEAWMDEFERVSPGPYLELFARRQRLGWDTWGDEALQHVEMSA
jgi:N6-adenosine-specific RNA methylase IME4